MRWLPFGFLVAVMVASGCDCRAAALRQVPDAGCEPESCDGLDNDCDGEVDNGLPNVSCGVGACLRVRACANGELITCEPGTPVAESCNGLDDDCDGETDEGACSAPVVTCPASQVAQAGVPVSLTATATDEGTLASLTWTVSTRPFGSSAQPTPEGSPNVTFTPDAPGSYELTFCAKDTDGLEACCTTALTSSACSSPPAPPVSTACATSWDGRPIVQFAAVPQGLTYELTAAGDAMVLASAAEGNNHLRPAARLAAGSDPPGTPVALEVRACRTADPSCCSTPSPVTVNVVSECTTVVAPTASNVVLSEYVVNGEGACPSPDCLSMDTCQAGEAVEITNLSNCPVALDGFHFAYRNANATVGSYRWMNFGAADVIPPRGVYVAIRARQYAPTCAAPLPPESAGLYGLKISALNMQGQNLCNGWFNNSGGGMSELRIAPGVVTTGASLSFTPGTAIARVAPYEPVSGSTPRCSSTGFDAVDSCGAVMGGSAPTQELTPNQLGRLWHPCDAVVNPSPACARD